MLLPPVVPGVPPGPQHHPTLPAGRGVTPRAPRHLCRHRNVVQSSNLSHHTHFGASLPLTSTPTVSCTTGASHQNLHVSDRRINVLIVARLPNRLPEGRLTKGVVYSKVAKLRSRRFGTFWRIVSFLVQKLLLKRQMLRFLFCQKNLAPSEELYLF